MQTGLMKIVAAGMLFSTLAITQLQAQWRFDVTAGVSPSGKPNHTGVIINRENPAEEFIFNVEKTDPQFFVGAKAHLEMQAPFFVEGGLQYSQRKSTYAVTYTIIDAEHPIPNHSLNHTEHLIMMPVNIGVNMGQFDVTSGIRAYHTFGAKTELDQLTGYATDSPIAKFGWQAGAGWYIGRSRLGVEYQSDFTRVGTGMSVNGHSLELNNIPGQFMLTLQQSF